MRPLLDRWQLLRTNYAHNGWVQVQRFILPFNLQGLGDVKHATYKATKRLREEGKLVKDDDRPGVVGRPKKIARVMDLQAVYPALTR